MSAKTTLRSNKTKIQGVLCGDYRFILDKVLEKNLITQREYVKLKSSKEDVEGQVVDLVDKMLNKGEKTCKDFLDLLQTDEEIKETLPELKHFELTTTCITPVQVSSTCDDLIQEPKRLKKDDFYKLDSRPVGLCVILNNMNFNNGSKRNGTDQDAQSLAEVFTWLGFRVLMCKDQTRDQMAEGLKVFASLNDDIQSHGLNIQEWSTHGFTAPQQVLQHGDAFFCCILSHGEKGVVLGTDLQPLDIKEIIRAFKATEESALTCKPKVFLIQACQGKETQKGVLLKDVEMDDRPLSVPEEADVLVAVATVEDHVSYRNTTKGSWFIQSVCQELKERCPRGDDFTSILHHVNSDVAQKEGSCIPGAVKQIPEVRFTLTKRLVLQPQE